MTNAIAPNWNAEIIEGVTADDTSPNKIVTRVSQKIADKGFHLIDVRAESGNGEGFKWGRSSYGETRKVLWFVTFEDDNGTQYNVLIIVQTITYTRANPYDRAPANNGVPQVEFRPGSEEVKKILGWKN